MGFHTTAKFVIATWETSLAFNMDIISIAAYNVTPDRASSFFFPSLFMFISHAVEAEWGRGYIVASTPNDIIGLLWLDFSAQVIDGLFTCQTDHSWHKATSTAQHDTGVGGQNR